MENPMIREIVTINEDLCDGCGLCVPSCHEGALRIVNGKAKLVADNLCDGLGACLGHCPRGAITVERRESDAFDEAAVAAHLNTVKSPPTPMPEPAAGGCPSGAGGCPGSRIRSFTAAASGAAPARNESMSPPSELTHWPVQLRLVPPTAPFLKGARLLVAADCVPVACADFHATLLRGRTVVISCPKFDDLRSQVEKLAVMIQCSDLAEIVVAHMEVPCCTGIVHAVLEARRLAKHHVPVIDVLIGVDGRTLSSQEIPADDICNSGSHAVCQGG
jgi:NAD-dependent dihydropyrimidine dehydrogenase PreA subunit